MAINSDKPHLWKKDIAASVDLYIESRRLQKQREIDASRSAHERNRLGQFATPPILADEILQLAKELWASRRALVRFLDPALGTGSFYSALHRVFAADQIEWAKGYEIDGVLAETASQLWAESGLEVCHADFTSMRPPAANDQKANLIICNPPYVRHHHLTKQQKIRLKQEAAIRTHVSLNGLAGLYCYFLLLSDTWLADEGLAIWLIPAEFMDVNYGREVKEYLSRGVSLRRIHRFDPEHVQFDDALVSSAVVMFEKNRTKVNTAQFTSGGTLLHPDKCQVVPLEALNSVSNKWTAFHEDFDSSTLDASAARVRVPEFSELRLANLFHIKRGLATGANEFFILERSKATQLGLPHEFLIPILPSPRFLDTNIIEADTDGFPRLSKQLVLLSCSLPPEMVEKDYPSLWQYLQQAHDRELMKRYLIKGRNPWYRQEIRPPAPFLCTYMGRKGDTLKPFRFVWNHSRATAPNVYLMLYPRAALGNLLQTSTHLAEVVFNCIDALSVHDMISEGRVYGGGLYKIEPNELGKLSAASLLAALPELKQQLTRQITLF